MVPVVDDVLFNAVNEDVVWNAIVVVFSRMRTGWPEERTSKATPVWLPAWAHSVWSTH